MIWVKSTILIHIIVQSLFIILIGLVASLPKQDVLVLTEFTKSELVSIISILAYSWQFFIAIIFFIVPPFAYKNQMLDLTILLAYPTLALYTFVIANLPVSEFIQSPAYWTIAILGIIYYFVSVLDGTGPIETRSKAYGTQQKI